MPFSEILVRGRPAPQGSKRLVGGHMIESSKAVRPWRDAIRTETQRAVSTPETGAVEVSVTFFMPRPRSHYRTGKNSHLLKESAPLHHFVTPDCDKLARACLDGLTEGGAWKDDAQVVHLDAWKVYADDVPPGCRIVISKAACE